MSRKNKKKRGFCFNCCMSLLVFNFVCVCLIIGVGWFFGDQLSKQYLDMSLKEAFGVFRGLTHSKGDIVNNAYSAEDEQGFYNSLGDALLLKDEAIDGNEFKATLMSAIDQTDFASEILKDYALGLLKSENFDKKKIDSMDEGDNARLQISDRELAAFVDGIVEYAVGDLLSQQLENAKLDEYGIDIEQLNASDWVNLEQLSLYEQDKVVEGSTTTVNMAMATVSINFDEILEFANDSFDPTNIADQDIEQYASLIKVGAKAGIGILKLVLPSKLYLTIKMGLSHNVEPNIYINDMGDTEMERMYKLLKIMDLDLESMINDLFIGDGAVANALKSVNDTAPLSQVLSDGGIDCDLYQFLIDVTKLNYGEDDVLKPEEQRLTSDDFVKVLQLVLSDNSEYIEQLKSSEYSYKNVSFKRNDDGTLDLSSGEPVIIDQDAQYYVTDGEELNRLIDDYEKLFLSRFSNSYGLKEEYDMQSIIEAFSGENFDADTAIDMFDTEKIKEIIKGEAQGVVINDKMLAALFAKMLPDLIKDASIDAECVAIEYIYLEERQASNHNILNIGLKIDAHSLIEGLAKEEITAVLNNLLNREMVIEVGLDITLGDVEYLPTQIMLNGNNAKVINKVLVAFDALGTDDEGNPITLDEYISDAISPVRDVIKNLDSTLAGLTIEESALKLPDVYVALSKVLNQEKQPGEDGYVDPDTLEDALKLVVEEGPLAQETGEYEIFREENSEELAQYNQASEQALMDELSNKYCLDLEVQGEDDYTLTEILHILGMNKMQEPTRVEGIEILDILSAQSLEMLTYVNGNWQQSLKVNITNVTAIEDATNYDMFTALVREVVFGGDIDFGALGEFDKDDLLFVKLSENGDKQYLSITIRVNLKDVLPNNEDEMQDFLTELLPSSLTLITLKIDITDSEIYDDCQIIINEKASSSQSLLDLLDSLGMPLDLNEIGDSIRESIMSLNDSLNVEFTDGAMLLPNVFAMIDEVALENMYGDGGEKIKEALSGVYRTSDTVLQGETMSNIEIFESNIDGTKPNDDYHQFMDDFKHKYFLVGEAAEAQTFDELYKYIHIDNFLATDLKIKEADGLAYTTKSIEELTPAISMGDLGALLIERVPSDLDIDFHSMRIDRGRLILNFAVPLSALFDEGGDYEKFITVQKLYAKVIVNIDSKVEEGDKKYYKCDIDINDMGERPQKTLLEIVGHFTETEQSLHGLEMDVGGWIRKAFEVLDDSYGNNNYDVTDDGIIMRDIFTFLEMNILGENRNGPEKIKAAIQGMYHSIDEVYNANNYHEDVVVKNRISLPESVPDDKVEIVTKIITERGILDKDLGAYIYKNIPENAELMQMSILAANPSVSSAQFEDRAMLNGMIDGEMEQDKTYIAMTAKMDVNNFADEEDGTALHGNADIILGDDMLATFIFEYTDETFVYFDFALNEMSTEIRYVLKDFTGLDIEHAMDNMEEVANEYLASINDLFEKVEETVAIGGVQVLHVFEEIVADTARGRYKISY